MKKILTLCFIAASVLFVHGTAADEPVPYPETSSSGGDTKVEPTGGDIGGSREASSGGSSGTSKGIVGNGKASKNGQNQGSLDAKFEGKNIDKLTPPRTEN